MKDFSELRKGNPVEINDEITYIKEVIITPEPEVKYIVFGSEEPYRELFPVRLDNSVQKTYRYLFNELFDQNNTDKIVFSGKDQEVAYDFEKNECFLNNDRIEGIKNLHQLFNIVEDKCGIILPHYYPLIDRNNSGDCCKRDFPIAPVANTEEFNNLK